MSGCSTCLTVCNSVCWALTLLLLVIAMGYDVLGNVEIQETYNGETQDINYGWQSSDQDNTDDYCDCDDGGFDGLCDTFDDLCTAGQGWIAFGIIAFLFGITASFLPWIKAVPAMITPIVGTLSTIFAVIFSSWEWTSRQL
eukprot:UN06685